LLWVRGRIFIETAVIMAKMEKKKNQHRKGGKKNMGKGKSFKKMASNGLIKWTEQHSRILAK